MVLGVSGVYVELGHDFKLSGLVLSCWFGTWPHAGRAGQHAGSLVRRGREPEKGMRLKRVLARLVNLMSSQNMGS